MNAVVETKKEADLTEIETDDLIEELEERGHSVDVELSDFTDDEIAEYLGAEDISGVDWTGMYHKIMCGNGEQAFEEFKAIIQDRTGRIIV
jgi:hypothetical protein